MCLKERVRLPQLVQRTRAEASLHTRAAGLLCRALIPLQLRCSELVQQKRYFAQQVAAMTAMQEEVTDLAAAVTCSFASVRMPTRKRAPGSAPPSPHSVCSVFI